MLKCGRKFKASVGRPDTLLRAASSSADLALGFQPPDSRSPGCLAAGPAPGVSRQATFLWYLKTDLGRLAALLVLVQVQDPHVGALLRVRRESC